MSIQSGIIGHFKVNSERQLLDLFCVFAIDIRLSEVMRKDLWGWMGQGTKTFPF